MIQIKKMMKVKNVDVDFFIFYIIINYNIYVFFLNKIYI